MSNPVCAVCGHTNRVGAEVCEMCDTRLGGAGEAGPPSGQPFHSQGEEPRGGALPTDIPLPQFKGAGDVMAPTLEVYKRNFPLVGQLVLVTALPLAALQIGAYYLLTNWTNRPPNDITDADARMIVLAGPFSGLLSFLLATVLNSMLTGALAYAVVELQRTGGAKAGDCLRWGLKKLPKVAAINFLYLLLLGGVGAVLVGGSILLLGPLGIIVVVLLLVPWIVFSLMFSVIAPVAAVENRGVVETFRRSAELTRGYKGLIFVTFFLWGLLVSVVNLVVTGSFALGGAHSSAVSMLLQALIGEMLQSTTFVLTIYIFLGLLNEHRAGFDTRAFMPAPADAAR